MAEIRDGSLSRCREEGWRRQERRMEGMKVDGEAPSPEQGQAVLLVLHAKIGRQVLIAHVGHRSSHQQGPESPGSPSTAPLPSQPRSSPAILRARCCTGEAAGQGTSPWVPLASTFPGPSLPQSCLWPPALRGQLAWNGCCGQLEDAQVVTWQPKQGDAPTPARGADHCVQHQDPPALKES